MAMSILVIDYNGVIADIRKIHSRPVPLQFKPDLVLPNGQKIYMRNGWKRFLRSIVMIARTNNAAIVSYTSRLAKNAVPLESFMDDAVPSFAVRTRLYGEDCIEPSAGTFHPTKSVNRVWSAFGRGNVPTVFMDDHPERIDMEGHSDAVSLVKVPTFTMDSGTDRSDSLSRALFDVWTRLSDVKYKI